MPNQDIRDLVAKRIDEDKQVASNVATKLTATRMLLTNDRIREFFPELESLPDSRRSNLPAGVPLPHQLLMGPPTVFDLEPVSPQEFERRYRISIGAAEELADLGRLLPNLYVRKPERWEGMAHLQGLVRRSLVNGERVDAYFRTRDARYEDLKRSRTEQLEKQLCKLEREEPQHAEVFVADSRNIRQDACQVIGSRWAYLDVLAPSASDRVAQLVEDCQLAKASEFIRLTKHLFVSPISAALGGEFTWGQPEIARLNQVGLSSPPWIYRGTQDAKRRESIEFLVHHITGVHPFHVLKEFQTEKLLELLRNEDLAVLKSKLAETTVLMTRLAQSGEVRESTVQDWKRLVEEVRQAMGMYEKRTRRAISLLVGLSVGLVIEPRLGIGAGVVAEVFLPEYTEKFGSAIHEFVNPEKHRFLVLLDELEVTARVV